MPITDKDLPGLPITRHGPSERIPAPKADTKGRDKMDTAVEQASKYVDWMEDDTERDPTPANKRRTEHMNETYPKSGDGPDFTGRQLGLKKGPLKL